MSYDDRLVKLTSKGQKVCLDGASPEAILIVEIMKRLPGEVAQLGNLHALAAEIVADYGGSVENAVTAIKSGLIQFREKTNEQ